MFDFFTKFVSEQIKKHMGRNMSDEVG